MAVQQNRKAVHAVICVVHDRITINTVAVDATTGENTSVTMRPKTVLPWSSIIQSSNRC